MKEQGIKKNNNFLNEIHFDEKFCNFFSIACMTYKRAVIFMRDEVQ